MRDALLRLAALLSLLSAAAGCGGHAAPTPPPQTLAPTNLHYSFEVKRK